MTEQFSTLTIEYSDDVQQVDLRVDPAIEVPVENHFVYFYFADQDDFIAEENYPVLAHVWDNDDDSIFDNM